ncbi:MAG: hypothetical protein JWR90_2901 [Marmoricola sp.]|jgi:hypothetical protein|nr:hypothetical protein [Marmoricola sp.]
MGVQGERVTEAPIDDLPFASRGDLGLDKRKVTQCALSRICGVCGDSLARPVAFLGSALEADRNAFHFPPSHVRCAEAALAVWADDYSVALGHAVAPEGWALVTTSGFEFIRATAEADDRRPVFSPNSVIEDRRLPA